jgi:predicted ATPase
MKLKELSVSGFKSIKRLDGFQPGPLNVLIGSNGAGKSNFISFFRFIGWMLTPPGQLQLYVGNNGGASAFLHDGPEVTQQIQAALKLETDRGLNEYVFRLFYAAGDTFRFADERYRFIDNHFEGVPNWTVLNPGVAEADLNSRGESGDITARTINRLIRRCIVHQFHNTSATARLKQRWNVDDSQWLKEDGANLAPFLLRLREQEPNAYQRIVATLRQLVPFFADFILQPVGNTVLLQWREVGSDVVFASYQGSDGMLRLIALLALLLQPEGDLPDVLLIDEPELGLHPQAVETVASLLKSVSLQKQVFVATQSPFMVDQFEPDDIVVVDRPRRESTFKRLTTAELKDWLADFEGGRAYSLSELWEKNVLGGSPTT